MQKDELEEKITIMEELIQGFAGRISVIETSIAEFLKNFMEQYRGLLRRGLKWLTNDMTTRRSSSKLMS